MHIIASLKQAIDIAIDQIPLMMQLKEIVENIVEIVKIPVIGVPASVATAIAICRYIKRRTQRRRP